MEIEKNLVVCSNHITHADMQALIRCANTKDRDLIVFKDEHWVMVYLDCFREDNHSVHWDDLSEAFHKIMKFAADHPEGFTYLKFDGGADDLEGFEVFNW